MIKTPQHPIVQGDWLAMLGMASRIESGRVLGRGLLLLLKAGDEDAAFGLELSGLFALPDARQADELAGLGEAADLIVEIDAPQMALVETPVLAFHLSDPFGGLLEKFLHTEFAPGSGVEVLLVAFESYEVVPAAIQDDVRRFFWVCRASAVTTLLVSSGLSPARRFWLTGSSQSSLFPE